MSTKARRAWFPIISSVALVVLTMLYPVIMYLARTRLPAWWLGVGLSGLGLARLLVARKPRSPIDIATAVSMSAFGAVLLVANDTLIARWYPAVVNVTLLSVFAASIAWPPTVIERLARLRHPDLPESGVRYTRAVTHVWCVFFIINGSISAITSLWASDEVWTLYNGFIAYVMMGVLFAAEYLVRQRAMRGATAP